MSQSDNTLVRVCPICHNRQHTNDPTRHNCVSVLLATLREVRAQLGEARAELGQVCELSGGAAPAAGVLALKLELEASQRFAEVAHQRGYAAGLRLAAVMVKRLGKKMPFGKKLLSRIGAELAQADAKSQPSV